MGGASSFRSSAHDPRYDRNSRPLSRNIGNLLITGAFAITLVMAFYFLAASAGRGALALEFRGGTGRGWLAFSAVVSLFLGIYLISTISTSSLTIPGLFLGVDLIIYGITLITLGAGLKKYNVIESVWPTKAA